MFSFDTDTKEIARLLGINPDPIAPSDGDILKPFGANQLPIPGAADAIALPTLVSVACDNLVMPLDMSVDQGKTPAETDSHTAASVDSLTGMALTKSHEQLQQFANSPEFLSQMSVAFGDDFDVEAAQDLADSLSNGTFQTSPIKVVSAADINGSNGAFAAETNNIYLSSELVADNADNPEAIVSVLLEEIGHYIDSQINISDAAGDEGAIFAGVVQGKVFDVAELQALKAEDDTATVMLDGKATVIEQASPSDFGINLYSANYSRSGNKFVASNGTGGTYLWCTDFAFGRALEKGLVQNYSGVGAKISGNAGQWDDQAGSWGRQARSNSFIVWDPSQGGAGSVGHVGFVERVNSDGSFVISEANWDTAKMSFNSRTIAPGSNAFNTAKFVYLQEATTQPSPTPPPTSAFRGTVDGALNIRSGPGTNFPAIGSLSAGSSRTFDGVARGTTHWDAREQRNDNRWFRLSGSNQWVSGAFITGNPLFNGTADTALNIRSGPGTNFPAIGSLSSGSGRTFDATTVGTTHWDPKEGKNENRWFRLQNTNNWISAAFITGNPTY